VNAIISQKRDAQGIGEHNNQPKQGTKAQMMAMSVRAVTVATAEARAMVAAYAAVRAEATLMTTPMATAMMKTMTTPAAVSQWRLQ
jgi:hypothetical protein